jgi:hypothetical protein
MGIRIPTVFSENNARRCEGCGEPIVGQPFRVTILDIVSTELPPSWAAEGARLNPGPHEFHPDPEHVRAWCRARGFLICRLSSFRQIMRPVVLPSQDGGEAGQEVRWGLCDGLHREEHEFIPA